MNSRRTFTHALKELIDTLDHPFSHHLGNSAFSAAESTTNRIAGNGADQSEKDDFSEVG
jgi:hypothetical protein